MVDNTTIPDKLAGISAIKNHREPQNKSKGNNFPIKKKRNKSKMSKKNGKISNGYSEIKGLDDDRVPDLTDNLYTYVDGERVGIGLYKTRLRNRVPGYTKEFFIPWYEEVFGYTPKEI